VARRDREAGASAAVVAAIPTAGSATAGGPAEMVGGGCESVPAGLGGGDSEAGLQAGDLAPASSMSDAGPAAAGPAAADEVQLDWFYELDGLLDVLQA
jgi:hypothetical protein